MQKTLLLTLAVASLAGVARDADAQERRESRERRVEPGRAFAYAFSDDADRAVIGVTTSTGSARDTLGVLVTSVVAGGPADRAGIEEGNRIAAINDVNLRLAPADVGDWEMASAMSRRLTRELRRVEPGAEVALRIYSGGQTRAVRLRTVRADSLYESRRRVRVDADERAALGISLGSVGSRRDTLGVLIMGIDDDGPAARAGLEEGNRIAAVNGVDLRVSRDDAGDEHIASARVNRLFRELAKLKPGDEVTLRIYSAGRTRDVRIKTVAASELPRRRTMIFRGGPGMERVPMPPDAPLPPGSFDFEPLFERHFQDGTFHRLHEELERIAPRIRGVFDRRVIL